MAALRVVDVHALEELQAHSVIEAANGLLVALPRGHIIPCSHSHFTEPCRFCALPRMPCDTAVTNQVASLHTARMRSNTQAPCHSLHSGKLPHTIKKAYQSIRDRLPEA